jgi:hypothetical protein
MEPGRTGVGDTEGETEIDGRDGRRERTAGPRPNNDNSCNHHHVQRPRMEYQ